LLNQDFHLPANFRLLHYQDSKYQQQILSLMEASFGKPFPKEHWDWKYRARPIEGGSSLVMLDGDRVVGHWGFSPVRYKLGPKDYIASISFDMAVDRKAFGRRTAALKLLEMAKTAYHVIESQGAVFGAGFPNTNSLFLGIKRLGWIPLVHILNLSCYLRLKPFLQKRISNRFIVGAADLLWRAMVKLGLFSRFLDLWPSWGRKVRKTESFDERADALWQSTSQKIGNAVVRDAKYLNWRYFSPLKPVYDVFIAERKSQLVGYIVLRIRQDQQGVKEAVIADILAKNHSPLIASQLILTAIRFAVKNHCDVVRAWCVKHSRYLSCLRTVGFLKRRSLVHFVLRPWTPDPTLAKQIMTRSAWHVMMGDSDSV